MRKRLNLKNLKILILEFEKVNVDNKVEEVLDLWVGK
jgi:hypothetical protein